MRVLRLACASKSYREFKADAIDFTVLTLLENVRESNIISNC